MHFSQLVPAVLMAVAAPAVVAYSDGSAPVPSSAENGRGEFPKYRYPLSGGDKLRVIVFGASTLGGDYIVDGEGVIALPLIGDVTAGGLTSAELAKRITDRLADGYMKEPRVAVQVLGTRPFYILGEVNKPGEYPFSNGLTVSAAVAQAGGYTYRAKTGSAVIQHAGAAGAARVPVSADTPVAPGDTVRVPERWF